MPLSTAQLGKTHGNLPRSQQTLLNSLSSPLYARPQLQLSVGSRQQEVPTIGLWLHLSVSPRTRLFSGTLHMFWRRKIPGICLGLWEPLASFLLRKELESCPQKLICKLHSLRKFYQLAHFKQVFTEWWENWTGWNHWINTFAYPGHQILRPMSFFTKSPVKAFYRYKNMKASSPSHLPGLRVTKKLYIFSASLVKHKQTPSAASVWELTAKTKEFSRLKNLSKQSMITLVMKNIAKRSTVLIIFTS